jgi:isocitrate dehydrogenase
MAYDKIKVPSNGKKVTMGKDGRLVVPDNPILPFIEGDGTGPDITKAAMIVWDAAVK